jgi:hypothetical protein
VLLWPRLLAACIQHGSTEMRAAPPPPPRPASRPSGGASNLDAAPPAEADVEITPLDDAAFGEVESPQIQPEPGPGAVAALDSTSVFDVVFTEPAGTPLGLGMLELHDPSADRDLLVLETVSGAAGARHPELCPGLVVDAINGAPTHGAFSDGVRAQMGARPVTITFTREGGAASAAAADAQDDAEQQKLMADILARKAEAEAGLGGKQGGGRLRRLAGAAKDRLKQLDERLDGTDDGRLEPSVLFRLPTGVNATGQRGARGGGGGGGGEE